MHHYQNASIQGGQIHNFKDFDLWSYTSHSNSLVFLLAAPIPFFGLDLIDPRSSYYNTILCFSKNIRKPFFVPERYCFNLYWLLEIWVVVTKEGQTTPSTCLLNQNDVVRVQGGLRAGQHARPLEAPHRVQPRPARHRTSLRSAPLTMSTPSTSVSWWTPAMASRTAAYLLKIWTIVS